MNNNIRDNLKKGCVELLLLSILSEDDMYGYQITQEMMKRSDGFLCISEGTMYPTLHKLEEKKYISSYEKQTGKRMRRVYYHIEPEGKRRLQELIREYQDLTQSILNFIGAPQSGKQDTEIR